MLRITEKWTLVSLALLAGITPTALGADWPQWRGIHRDGTSAEHGLVEHWPDAGPRIEWRTTVGAGYSGVAVSDGRLYTLGDLDGVQYLFCLDALTGKESWRHELGPPFRHPYGDGPRSTPLVDGDVVFAVGTQGTLLAANRATGETVWRHDLVRAFDARLPSYGFSSSPLVLDDKLFIEAGGANGTFMAFRKAGGEVVWSSQHDLPAYSSPIVATIHGTRQIVFWSAGGLRALSPDDGALLWKYDSQTLCPATGAALNTGTPILTGPERIFMSSGSGATLLHVVRTDSGFRAEPVWHSEQMRSDVNTPVLVGQYVYGFHRGVLQSLDVRTGDVRWRARGLARGSLVAADGKLIVLGEAGNLALVSATPDAYVPLATAQVLDGRNWTAPSLADGRLYLRNQDTLLRLNLKGE